MFLFYKDFFILEQSNKVRIIAGKRYWIPRVKEFLDKNPSVDKPMLEKLANEKVLPGYLGSYEKWEDLPYTDRVSEAINFTVKAPKMVKQGIPTKKRGGGLKEYNIKLNKSKLKQIIREEIENTLQEQVVQGSVSARVISTRREGNIAVVTVEGIAPERIKGKKAEGRAKIIGRIGFARQKAAARARLKLLKLLRDESVD